MEWKRKNPVFGDMIRVKCGSIYHFGIYASSSEVIQFGLAPSLRVGIRDCDVEVLTSSLEMFCAGGELEVCEFDKAERSKIRAPQKIVDYARHKIGTKGYHILYNNCEHFANECVSGERICRQAESVREMFRKMPIVDVYIAPLPASPIGILNCRERMEEIENSGNESVKREKYFSWKLLCYALERSLGIRDKELKFKKEECGAWTVSGAEISISHSKNALAVAVSRAPVGVDIEKISAPRAIGFAERILTEKELSIYESIDNAKKEEALIELWTAKEAIFKSQKKNAFIPRKIDTDGAKFNSKTVLIEKEAYSCTVATSTPERVRFFENIDLTKY